MTRRLWVLLGVAVVVAGGATAWALGGEALDPPAYGPTEQAATLGRSASPVDCSQPPPATLIAYTGQRWDITAGPLTFIGAGEGAREPASAFRRQATWDPVWKTPVAVKPGHMVTIRVAAPARRTAALTHFLPYGTPDRVSNGASAVTFQACPPSAPRSIKSTPTTWGGGLIVNRPQCVPLEVFIDDRQEPEALLMPLGMRSCR